MKSLFAVAALTIAPIFSLFFSVKAHSEPTFQRCGVYAGWNDEQYFALPSAYQSRIDKGLRRKGYVMVSDPSQARYKVDLLSTQCVAMAETILDFCFSATAEVWLLNLEDGTNTVLRGSINPLPTSQYSTENKLKTGLGYLVKYSAQEAAVAQAMTHAEDCN